MKKLIIVAASVVLAGAVLASDIGNGWEYHGYGRGGTEVNSDFAVPNFNGPDNSLSANGNQGVQTGRLGNTTSNYVEVELVKDFQAQNGVWSKWHVLGAASTTGINSWNNTNGGTFYLREAYAEMGGFSWNPSATIWAGQRYYDRNNIWITDYYVTDYTGTGAGIQGLMNGNLNVAWIATNDGNNGNPYYAGTNQNQNAASGSAGVTLTGTTNTIVTDYQLGQWGLQGAVKYNNYAQQATCTGNANAASAIWGGQVGVTYNQPTWYGLTNGWAQTIVQYGQGLSGSTWNMTYGGAHGSVGSSPTDRTYNLTTTGVASVGQWQIQNVVGLLRNTTQYNNSTTNTNIVLSPMYSFNQNFAMMFDMGYAYNWANTGVNGGVAQFTIAPTFTLSSDFFARPQIRPFVAYLIGNSNQISLNGNNHAFLFGAQAEVWF